MEEPKRGAAVPKTLLELCQLQARQIAFTLYGMDQSLKDHVACAGDNMTPDEQRLLQYISRARDNVYEAQTYMGEALKLFDT